MYLIKLLILLICPIINIFRKCIISYLLHIDTAVVYRNEEDIGYALKNLLPKYNLQRSDIFITTKLCMYQ